MASGTLPCRPGTLIFQDRDNTGLATVIETASGAPLTHVAMITGENGSGQCMAIEAFGPVKEIPVATVLSRKARNFYKLVPERFADALVRSARQFQGQPYDREFKNGNVRNTPEGKRTPLYCSELIAESAKQVPLPQQLDQVSIPASWLNFDHPAVKKYVRGLGYQGPADPKLKQHRLTTVVDLYFHNILEDLPGPAQPGSRLSVRNLEDARFDTIPGETVLDKFGFLSQQWGRNIDRVHYETDPDPSRNNHRFWLNARGKTYSLILFGIFPEEQRLATMILEQMRLRGNAP